MSDREDAGAYVDTIGAEQAQQCVVQDLEKMSRERLVPDEKTLEKIACYEQNPLFP